MSKVLDEWVVITTPCYPNMYKVVNTRYAPYNGTSEYFPTKELAQIEADRRNLGLCPR